MSVRCGGVRSTGQRDRSDDLIGWNSLHVGMLAHSSRLSPPTRREALPGKDSSDVGQGWSNTMTDMGGSGVCGLGG